MNFSSAFVVLFVSILCCEVGSWRTSRGRRSLFRKLRESNVRKEVSRKSEWFEQKLDHFSTTTTATWKQRYFTNAKVYKVGGPVFLYINGEAAASADLMDYGAWIEYAKEFHALCFQLEHRYYGSSHPTKDLSVENLKHLSSEQVLADLASFIQGVSSKHELPADTKWVAFGGSYAGNLAAWLRLKHPDLVHAAVSSSGPLMAVADFKGYYGAVAASLSTDGDSCVEAILAATEEMDGLLGSSEGPQNMNTLFSLCDPIDPTSTNDVASLYSSLADYIADAVQYNNDDWKSWNTSTTNIDDICRIMTNTSIGSPMQRYAALNHMYLNTSQEECLDYSYKSSVESLLYTSWASDKDYDGDRQWTYQTCTEFGLFGTSSQEPHVFGNSFPLDFFLQQCSDVFGPGFNATSLNAGIERTNQMYGGKSIQVSNVVFVQGSIDPWHVLGVTHSTSPSAPAIFIQGASHCSDMDFTSSADLPQITEAHRQIRSFISQWLSG